MTNNKASSTTILRLHVVYKRLGVCRSTIYGWLDSKSKQHIPDFPRPIRIGRAAIGWIEAEIDAYLQSRRDSAHNVR